MFTSFLYVLAEATDWMAVRLLRLSCWIEWKAEGSPQ